MHWSGIWSEGESPKSNEFGLSLMLSILINNERSVGQCYVKCIFTGAFSTGLWTVKAHLNSVWAVLQFSGVLMALQSSLSFVTRSKLCASRLRGWWTAFAAGLINGVCLAQLSFKARLSVLNWTVTNGGQARWTPLNLCAFWHNKCNLKGHICQIAKMCAHISPQTGTSCLLQSNF